MNTRTSLTAMVVIGMLCGATAAAPIAYEGFSPGGGSTNIVGTSDGTGFTGPWAQSVGTGTINRTPDNNNMTAFPSNVPFATPTGGKGQFVSSSPWNERAVTRTLAAPINLSSDGHVYLSYLYNDYQGANPDREARVFLGNASTRLQIGPVYQGDRLGIAETNATQVPWSVPAGQRADSAAVFGGYSGNPLLFVVAELEMHSVGNDVVRVKGYEFSPGDSTTVDAAAALVTWDAVYSFNGSGSLDQLGLFMEGLGWAEFDEIRLGTQWVDVTGISLAADVPEPATAVLSALAMAGLSLYARRRRKI